ncbi:hypothetical protein [Candidatus Clostridium stratigraminis]|uniref:Phage abortive infection protein n=1 Tax=Candidatus Clostridium stratigraminis TaxID=3381661 RepID=A0ABW8T164_9CLOT
MNQENIKVYNLKYEKLKLHTKYIIAISLGLISLVIISRGYSNNIFIGQVGFAATISSIILSVIAILMTIIGETKSDNTKDKLVNVSDELEVITKSIGDATNKLEATLYSSQELFSGINNIQSNIDQLINSKSIETNEEMVMTKIDTENEGHSCYINIFEDAGKRLNEVNYKDLALVLFYIGVKKKCGFNKISYQEFTEDMKNLKIQFNDLQSCWYASLLFSKALWKTDDFNKFIYNTIKNRYSYEVNNIKSLSKINSTEK